MKLGRAIALATALAIGLSLGSGTVSAQTETATAEDGAPASEAPETTSTAPSVPVGANLTPPVGLPPGPPLIHTSGTGQSGSSSVSMLPGSLTSGVAREGDNAVRAPESDAAPVVTADADADPAPAAVPSCGDYPTWYDAQIALESSIDTAVMASLDPDGNAIACEEVMYPES